MGLENIAEGHGIGIAVTGMAVVIVGLVLISLFVAGLPRALDAATSWRARRTAGRGAEAGKRGSAPDGGRKGRKGRGVRIQAADAGVMGQVTSLDIDPDLLAAIGFVVEAERSRVMTQDRQRITMRDDDEQAAWTAIGKMRTLSTRL